VRVVVIGGWAPSLLKFRGPLLAAMVQRGHQVTAMAADQDHETTAGLAAIGVDFQCVAVERAGLDPRSDLKFIIDLRRRLRELRADVVFAYTIKPVVYGAIAARAAGVKQIAAMITGLGYAFAPPTNVSHRAVAAVARNWYRIGLRQCRNVFFQNADDRQEFERLRLLPAGANVTIVRGSGVDIVHYAVAPFQQSENRTKFLFIGRLLLDKGIREYAAMAREVRKQFPLCQFTVVGWLDPNPSCVTQAELDSWTADGSIDYRGPQSDVRNAIAQCDVLVLPSYREGTPRVVLEAMSMGRPVITTDAPGCRDTIVDGEHGFLVPVRNVAALVSSAKKMIENRALIVSYGAAARQRIETLYDARAVANHVLDSMNL
jgi:glycosyltransferase involved in cell wall biosynthesis